MSSHRLSNPSFTRTVIASAWFLAACGESTNPPTAAPGEPAAPPAAAAESAHGHGAHHDHAPGDAASTPPNAPVVGTLDGAKATHLMEAHVRAMPPGSTTTAAFFILHNPSTHDAAVVGGQSPAVASVELHAHVQEGDTFKMRQIDRIDVPAGEQVRLEPGGLHVMLIGLKAPLAVGDTLSLTLEFEGGHTQAFDIPVREIAENTHAHDAHSAHGDHSKHGDHAHH